MLSTCIINTILEIFDEIQLLIVLRQEIIENVASNTIYGIIIYFVSVLYY